MATNSVGRNDLFREVIAYMFKKEKWVADTKIARKLYKDSILEEREGYLMIEGGVTNHPNDPTPKYRSCNALALLQSQFLISGRRFGKSSLAARVQVVQNILQYGLISAPTLSEDIDEGEGKD